MDASGSLDFKSSGSFGSSLWQDLQIFFIVASPQDPRLQLREFALPSNTGPSLSAHFIHYGHCNLYKSTARFWLNSTGSSRPYMASFVITLSGSFPFILHSPDITVISLVCVIIQNPSLYFSPSYSSSGKLSARHSRETI